MIKKLYKLYLYYSFETLNTLPIFPSSKVPYPLKVRKSPTLSHKVKKKPHSIKKVEDQKVNLDGGFY